MHNKYPVANTVPEISPTKRFLRRVGVPAALAATALFSVEAVYSPDSLADTPNGVVHHIYRTGQDGVWLHASPGLSSQKEVVMPEGSEFDVSCWTESDQVRGNKVWLEGTYKGKQGAVTDYYIDDHWNTTQDLTNQGIGECGTTSQPTPQGNANAEGLQPAAPAQPFTSFDRGAAARWALDHAMQAPGISGVDSCTWFASEELGAGGLHQDGEWNLKFHGIESNGHVRHGTDAAWIAPQLAEHLQKLPYVKIEPLGGMNSENNDIPDAKPGDLIAYVWHGDNLPTDLSSLNKVEHMSVVVGPSSPGSSYPLVAEWGNTTATPYKSRGWTYSMKSNGWLQNEPGQHNMFAYLIHIVSENDIDISNH